jgi:hypothetical protein
VIARLLADLLVLAHFAFILFAIIGGALALRWHWMPWLHLPAAGWAAWIALMGWICPLTPLENSLRRASGSGAYSGGFIDHYIMPILYPVGLTRTGQILLGVLVLMLNAAIYAAVWRGRRDRTSR